MIFLFKWREGCIGCRRWAVVGRGGEWAADQCLVRRKHWHPLVGPRGGICRLHSLSRYHTAFSQPLGPEVPRHMAGLFIPHTDQELGPPEGLTLLWSSASQYRYWAKNPPLSCSSCCAEKEEKPECPAGAGSSQQEQSTQAVAPACSLCHVALSLLAQWLPLTLRVSTKNLSSGNAYATASSLKRNQCPQSHRLFPSWAARSDFRA